MIQILYHRAFLKEFKRLPKAIRQKLADLENLFRLNPFHPELHAKKLAGKLKPFYSFRVTRDYRVIFEITAESEAAFLAVRHRKDIYR